MADNDLGNPTIIGLASILVIAGRLLPGQTTFASLRGTVRDPSGAAIPNATVTVRNSATQVLRDTRSDVAGAYNFFDLLPSIYEITIGAPGFATGRQTDIELAVNAEQVLDFTLNPSNVQSRVEVHSEAASIDLDSSALAYVENATSIRELPLNGRDWTQLALLEPGVSPIHTQNALNGSNSNRGSRGFGSAVTIDGTRPTQSSYLVDRISQNDTNGVPDSALGLELKWIKI